MRKATLHLDMMTLEEVAELAAIRDEKRRSMSDDPNWRSRETPFPEANDNPILMRIARTLGGSDASIGWCAFKDFREPLHIHADTGEGDNFHHLLVIMPLDSDHSVTPPPSTVFFEQHWFGRKANFVKGQPEFRGTVNMTVADYSDVVGLTDKPFPEEFRKAHLMHINPSNLEGLSPESNLVWCPGAAICALRSQLHCGAHFAEGVRRSVIMRVVRSIETAANDL